MLLALGGIAMTAQAQQTKLYLDVTPPGGPAQVREIPLKPGANVDVRADGHIAAACALDAQGNCPNLGSGGGTPPAIASFPDISVMQGANTPTLKWVTTGEACYGVSPTNLSSWHTGLAGTNTVGLPLNALAVGTYDFKIRCYSPGGHTTDVATWVPGLPTDSIARVVVQQEAPPLEFCNEYLVDLQANNPAEYAKYASYRAENRGFTRSTAYTTFIQKTGKTLGADTGSIPVLPGQLDDTQYMALAFVMPAAGTGGNTGRFGMTATLVLGGALEHETILAISPCPGDFRPRATASSETYLRPVCRTPYTSGTASIQGNVTGSTECSTPAGKTMYLNIALRNLYLDPGVTPPADHCPTGAQCGVGVLLSN